MKAVLKYKQAPKTPEELFEVQSLHSSVSSTRQNKKLFEDTGVKRSKAKPLCPPNIKPKVLGLNRPASQYHIS